jgi:hypothetical protein
MKFYRLPNGNLVDPRAVLGVQAWPAAGGKVAAVVVRTGGYSEVIATPDRDPQQERDRIVQDLEELS